MEKYVHSYPNCWRTDKPILYYPLDSWFIKVSKMSETLVEKNKKLIGNQNLPVLEDLKIG